MDNFYNQLKNFIDNFSIQSSYTPSKTNRTVHIYFDMEKLASNSISINDKMKMFYLFCQNEACLTFYRKRNINVAEIAFNKLNEFDIKINSIIDNGMLSLYFAMAAYRDYVHLNYSEAEIKLDRALHYSIEQSQTLPRFLIALQDQWFSKLRIYARINDCNQTKIIDESIALFFFTYTGIMNNKDISINFYKNSFQDIAEGISYFFNQFIKITDNMIGQKKVEDFYFIALNKFKQIIFLYDSDLRFDISRIILLLASHYNGETSAFLNDINEHISLIQSAPYFIRKKIINIFLSIAAEYKIDLSTLPNFNSFSEKIKQDLNINYYPNDAIKSIENAA